MARLISEDEEIKSVLEIIFLKEETKSKDLLSWVPYKLIIESGNKKLLYEKSKSPKGAGDYVFALKPVDEIKNLTAGITDFIENNKNKTFFFEPIEPSFELIIEKSVKGYSVTCWVDAGNVISNHYTWDAFGIRFFTSKEKILKFTGELQTETAYAKTN